MNPAKESIRLFLPFDPEVHDQLIPSPSSKSWGKRFPAVLRIKSEKQLETAAGLIERALNDYQPAVGRKDAAQQDSERNPKYNCRICWNTEGWTFPTGEAAQSETGTYVSSNGFGHEEWLFNFEWIINGWKYGRLQPVARSLEKLADESIDLCLYTLSPRDGAMTVGSIDGVRVLDEEEAEFALSEFRNRGWLDDMATDLKEIDVNPSIIRDSKVLDIFNVAFDPQKVKLLDPVRVLQAGDPLYPSVNRYVLTSIASDRPEAELQGDKMRRGSSEPNKTATSSRRKSTAPIQVQLRHTRLQNQLFEFLRARGDEVMYEEDHVDLKIKRSDADILLELKTASSARLCIREGLGQILEYAYWGEDLGASTLAIAGRVHPSPADIEYLKFLRGHYGLPLQYWKFDSEAQEIEEFP